MSTTSTLKAIVCEHDAGVRARIRSSLEQAGIQALEAAGVSECLDMARTESPDILVLGAQPGGGAHEHVLREIKADPGLSGLFILLMDVDADDWCASVADGVLDRDAGPDTLSERITEYMGVRDMLAELRERVGRLHEPGPAQALSLLTEREIQVARLIALGYSTKECAAALGIRFKTAATHRANLMQKLGLRSIAQIVRFAVRAGLITP